jgi:predicted nucleic-acid-binding protein
MAKPAKCLLDTNVVLRYLLSDVPEQLVVAKQVFDELRTGERTAILLESVLAECVNVLKLHYMVPKDELATHALTENPLQAPRFSHGVRRHV